MRWRKKGIKAGKPECQNQKIIQHEKNNHFNLQIWCEKINSKTIEKMKNSSFSKFFRRCMIEAISLNFKIIIFRIKNNLRTFCRFLKLSLFLVDFACFIKIIFIKFIKKHFQLQRQLQRFTPYWRRKNLICHYFLTSLFRLFSFPISEFYLFPLF